MTRNLSESEPQSIFKTRAEGKANKGLSRVLPPWRKCAKSVKEEDPATSNSAQGKRSSKKKEKMGKRSCRLIWPELSSQDNPNQRERDGSVHRDPDGAPSTAEGRA